MGALIPAIFEELGIRHLAFSIPQLKEIVDGEGIRQVHLSKLAAAIRQGRHVSPASKGWGVHP